ncbi:hypothetical protein [Rhizobium sp. SG2393]|uniref:hypothetical protein n=1 Tax=Rhizobium sp. SG2393 TaxID=3276279 RepID=UPI00366DB648
MRFVVMILMMLSAAGLAGAPVHAQAMALAGIGSVHHHGAGERGVAAAAAVTTGEAHHAAAHPPAAPDERHGGSHASMAACAACFGIPTRIVLPSWLAVGAERLAPSLSAILLGRGAAPPFRPPRSFA